MIRRGETIPSVDKGYAWVILFACTFSQFGIILISVGANGLYVAICNKFPDSSMSEVALIGTIQLLVYGISGFFLGAWADILGRRRLYMGGALVATCGLVASPFMPTLITLYLTYGVMTGFGCTVISVINIVAVQEYFTKRKSLALGLLMTGSSAGVVAGHPLSIWLSNIFALPGVFLFYAGLLLQSVWLGYLIRPYHHPARSSKKTNRSTMIESIDLFSNVIVVETSAGQKVAVQPQRQSRASLLSHSRKRQGRNSEELDMQMITEADNLEPESEEANSAENITTNRYDTPVRSKWKERLLTGLGFSMCGDCSYWLFIGGSFLLYCGHFMVLVCLPLVDEQRLAVLVVGSAWTTLVASPVAGAVGDCMPNRRRYMTSATAVCAGILSSCSVFLEKFTLVFVYACVSGALGACYLLWLFITAADMFGRNAFSSYVGHNCMIVALSIFMVKPVSAFIIYATSQESLPFVIFGIIQCIGGGLVLSSTILVSKGR